MKEDKLERTISIAATGIADNCIGFAISIYILLNGKKKHFANETLRRWVRSCKEFTDIYKMVWEHDINLFMFSNSMNIDASGDNVSVISFVSYSWKLALLNSWVLSIWQIIFEGVYALHPDIREALDLWIAVVRMNSLYLFIIYLFFSPSLALRFSLTVLFILLNIIFK